MRKLWWGKREGGREGGGRVTGEWEGQDGKSGRAPSAGWLSDKGRAAVVRSRFRGKKRKKKKRSLTAANAAATQIRIVI